MPTTRRQLQPFAKARRWVRTVKEKAPAMLQRWSYCSGGVLIAVTQALAGCARPQARLARLQP